MTQTARTLKANVVTHCSKEEELAIVPRWARKWGGGGERLGRVQPVRTGCVGDLWALWDVGITT